MRNHQRGKDKTVLGVSMTKELKARIEKAAGIEKRTMANWAAYQLEKIVTELEAELAAQATPPLSLVADAGDAPQVHARSSVKYPKGIRLGK